FIIILRIHTFDAFSACEFSQTRMNIVVDNGNTSTKVGIFDGDNLVDHKVFQSLAEVKALLEATEADNILVGSVRHDPSEILSFSRAPGKFILDHDLPLPIQNHYKTPKTLGVDRIAGVCGGLQLFPGFNTLVIDAGTCVTYDLIDAEKNYRGGAISPGLRMRFRAVHEFTARLPLVGIPDNVSLWGDTTESAIQSGVCYGMIAEMEGMITAYQQQYGNLKTVLTGGDAPTFENRLKASIFASPNLVLIGLNSILNHNVNR
ncbi:MAG TPA: type III pantothenate kinase, partial [Cyclobacteriaceae bacterium]